MTNLNFNPSLFVLGNMNKREQSLLNYATFLAKTEIVTWKYHDMKSPVGLKSGMARLYTHLFPIHLEQALEILNPWISAVWWHDIAETAQDYGAPKYIQQKYWSKVRKNLRDHYGRLLKLITGADENISIKAKQIADHDYERWIAHHERRFEDYVIHDAAMIILLFNIPAQEAYEMAAIRGQAVWLHNGTHLETGVTKDAAEKLWWEAEKIMKDHYTSFLYTINDQKRRANHLPFDKKEDGVLLPLQI